MLFHPLTLFPINAPGLVEINRGLRLFSLSKRCIHYCVRNARITAVLLIFIPIASCNSSNTLVLKSYPPDVAVAWMNMQLRLTKGTTGYNSVVSNRSYAYVGLTLYESIAAGIQGHRSVAAQLNGSLVLAKPDAGKKYFWPASANAALALISRKFLQQRLLH